MTFPIATSALKATPNTHRLQLHLVVLFILTRYVRERPRVVFVMLLLGHHTVLRLQGKRRNVLATILRALK